MMIRTLTGLAACLLTASLALAENPPSETDYRAGQALVKTECATCHAVDTTDISANPAATAFWQLYNLRDHNEFEERLARNQFHRETTLTGLIINHDQARQIALYLADKQPILHGKRIVEANCERCHSVGRDGQSQHPEAPPFRTLSQFYPVDALEESFAEGIVTGHPDMPVFVMTELQLTDVIIYLETIQESPPPGEEESSE